MKTHTGTHLHMNWDRYQQQGDKTGFDGMGAMMGGRFGSFQGFRVAINCFW